MATTGAPVYNSGDDGGMVSGDWDNGMGMMNVEERMDLVTARPDTL